MTSQRLQVAAKVAVLAAALVLVVLVAPVALPDLKVGKLVVAALLLKEVVLEIVVMLLQKVGLEVVVVLLQKVMPPALISLRKQLSTVL